MNSKQRLAVAAPIPLILVMIPVFRLLSAAFGIQLGWYLGLISYWIVWCAAFSFWIIGAGFFGVYLSVLANKTQTVWWGIVAHTLGGMVMVV